MRKMKTCIIAALIICLFLPVFSCAKDSGSEKNSDVSANANLEESDVSDENREAVRFYSDAPQLDLGGRDFVIMSNDYSIPIWSQRDISPGEIMEDTISDAVYRRNAAIEEKYNCKIVEKKGDTLAADIKKYARSNDSVADCATVRLRDYSSLASSGLLVEFSNLQYIDLDKPWWDSNSAAALSITNKLYGVCSDLTLMDNDSTSAMVFNKQILEDQAVENPYELVANGNWTLAKLQEMSKNISGDLNGDGVWDDTDRYGLLYQRDTMSAFLNGSGEYVARKDADDVPYLTLNTEKAMGILNSLYDFLYNDQICFHVMKYYDPKGIDFTEGMNKMFQNDQSLFMWIRMADVENLRTMSTNFGILPTPKYNEQQEEYLSSVNPYVGVCTAVPQFAKDLNEVSAVLDALSCESRYVLHPAYYDICLNSKIARDDESSAMLDIIFKNRTYDIGDIFDFGALGSDVIYMTMTFDRNIVSKYEQKEALANKAIQKLLTAYEKLEG